MKSSDKDESVVSEVGILRQLRLVVYFQETTMQRPISSLQTEKPVITYFLARSWMTLEALLHTETFLSPSKPDRCQLSKPSRRHFVPTLRAVPMSCSYISTATSLPSNSRFIPPPIVEPTKGLVIDRTMKLQEALSRKLGKKLRARPHLPASTRIGLYANLRLIRHFRGMDWKSMIR